MSRHKPKPPRHSIFVCYRHKDEAAVVRHIVKQLGKRYGRDAVFLDVSHILAGEDFADVLQKTLTHCRVGLVMIGPRWSGMRDAREQFRLEDSNDFVRIEIETLLSRSDIGTIPVLIGQTPMPESRDLPETLRRLCRLQGVSIRPNLDFDADMGRLTRAIDVHLNAQGDRVQTTGTNEGWPAEPPEPPEWNVANQVEVREAFCSLITSRSPRRVLLLEGRNSGCGKTAVTTALATIASSLPRQIHSAWIDLKSGVDLDQNVDKVARELRVEGVAKVSDSVGGVEALRRLFRHVEHRKNPTILIFDAFEQGGEYAKWVENDVLHAAGLEPWLRVVVAGKVIPNHECDEAFRWRDAAERIELQPATCPADWVPIFAKRRPDLSAKQVEIIIERCISNLTAVKDIASGVRAADALRILRQAKGDPAELALGSVDLAFPCMPVENRANLRSALEIVAIPHWFDGSVLSALVDARMRKFARQLATQLRTLGAVEPFAARGKSAANVHEATRLVLRRKWRGEREETFRGTSLRAAEYFASTGDAPHLLIESLYHRFAYQPEAASETAATLVDKWDNMGRNEERLALAGMLEEVLAENLVNDATRAQMLVVITSCRFYHQNLALTDQAMELAITLAGAARHEAVIADCHFWVGRARKEQGQLDAAEAAFRRALEIRRQLAEGQQGRPKGRGRLARTLNWLGHVLRDRGCIKAALDCFQESHSILEQVVKQASGGVASRRHLAVAKKYLGYVLGDLDDLKGAGKLYRDSLAVLKSLASTDSGNLGLQCDLAVAYHCVGQVLRATHQLPDARTAFRKALNILERVVSRDRGNLRLRRELAIARLCLAQVERERRKFELAEDLLALAHQDFKGLIEQDKANTTWQREQALAFEENGRLLLDVGRHDDSLTEFRKALDLRTQLTGLDPANSQWQVELAINRIETGELLAVDPNGRTEAKTELRCALDVLDRLPNERRHNAAAEQARARARRCMKSLSKASDDSLDARKPDPLTGQL